MSAHVDLISSFAPEEILGMGRTGLAVRQGGFAVKLPLTWKASSDEEVEANIKSLQDEQAIYQRLGECDGIVSLVDFSKTSTRLHLMENGDLRSYLNQNKPPRNLQLSWFRAMARTLAYIHDQRVIVSDIASRNFLLDSDLSIKFCDFTESIKLPLDTCMETANYGGYGIQTDIGQLGAVMYEVVAGERCEFDIFKYMSVDDSRGTWPPREDLPSTEEFLSRDLSLAAYPDGKFQLVEPATELKNDGHRNKFTKTGWTDDTDHALLILLSYLHSNGQAFYPADLASRLRFWYEQGLRCLDRLPLGLGMTVGRVVSDEHFLEDPIATAHRHRKASNCKAAPNGSLMRTHPLGIICLDKKLEDTFQTAADFSRITHADPRCIVSCCLATGMIRGLLRGEILREEDIDTMISLSLAWVEDWIAKENQNHKSQDADASTAFTYPTFDIDEFNKHVRAESLEELQLDDMRKMGYVYKTLGAGIRTLRAAMRQMDSQASHESLFEELITSLVLCGGDADTNAAVAGSLLGALLGFNALPWSWKDGLMNSQWLSQKCDALASVCGIGTFPTTYTGTEDPDTRVDGGQPPLTKEELDQREQAFMEAYMVKSTQNAGRKTQESGWMGRWFRN